MNGTASRVTGRPFLAELRRLRDEPECAVGEHVRGGDGGLATSITGVMVGGVVVGKGGYVAIKQKILRKSETTVFRAVHQCKSEGHRSTLDSCPPPQDAEKSWAEP